MNIYARIMLAASTLGALGALTAFGILTYFSKGNWTHECLAVSLCAGAGAFTSAHILWHIVMKCYRHVPNRITGAALGAVSTAGAYPIFWTYSFLIVGSFENIDMSGLAFAASCVVWLSLISAVITGWLTIPMGAIAGWWVSYPHDRDMSFRRRALP